MTLWDDLICKATKIGEECENNIKGYLKASLDVLDAFEKECLSGCPNDKSSARFQSLQSIIEDEVEVTPPKTAESQLIQIDSSGEKSMSQDGDQAASKKRGKVELGNNTPEHDKRPKRGASVRAQAVINQQVNVNLTAKLRRPEDLRANKENRSDNIPLIKVKEERISLPAEQCVPDAAGAPVKAERDTEIMPPPPPSKSRRQVRKKAESETEPETLRSSSRPANQPAPSPLADRRTRASSRQASREDVMPPPPEDARPKRTRARKNQKQDSEIATESESEKPKEPVLDRRTRASSRQASREDEMPPPPEDARPKRTRARKNQKQDSETATESEPEKPKEPVIDVAEKPRPKRTRRGRKASEPKSAEHKADGSVTPPQSSLREKQPLSSPVISVPAKKIKRSLEKQDFKEKRPSEGDAKQRNVAQSEEVQSQASELDETKVLSRDTLDGVASHTTEVVCTGELGQSGQPPRKVLDETIVLSKNTATNETVGPSATTDHRMTDTDEEIEDTPPRSMIPVKLIESAVKKRVQQFEKLAASRERITRNQTRALSKQTADEVYVTPPNDKLPSASTKPNLPPYKQATSQSATKPRANIISTMKSFLPTSANKPTAAAARQDDKKPAARLEDKERDKEDARKKKEALLEAKREEQRRRREQKTAAAAAARDAQARERRLQLEAKAAGWQEKQALLDLGRVEKLKEAERKRVLLEKKAAETEERRRAEEAARLARLEEEQRRAESARKRQQEEAERIRREEARNEREMAAARAEYLRKQEQRKLEQLHAPMSAGAAPPVAPVHMEDGFQYLHSDSEDDERPKIPVPEWCRPAERMARLRAQEQLPVHHVDALFSVQRHTPDLAALFPAIDRRVLKRTSSAVWRTPPRLSAHLHE